jgi:hypothetical protein
MRRTRVGGTHFVFGTCHVCDTVVLSLLRFDNRCASAI